MSRKYALSIKREYATEKSKSKVHTLEIIFVTSFKRLFASLVFIWSKTMDLNKTSR